MEQIKIEEQTTTLVDVVETSILKYIKDNALTIGDNLPSEEELSKSLGVGRNVVREALSRLRSVGLLESRKHKGITLKEPDIKKNLKKLINPQMLSNDSIVDLLELRYTLEVAIVPIIINRITEKDIEDLKEILKTEFPEEGNQVPIESEIKFHSRIYQITGNLILMYLQQTIIPLYRIIHDNFSEFDIFNKEIKAKKMQATHKEILNCLISKNIEACKEVMTRHLLPYELYVNAYRKHEE